MKGKKLIEGKSKIIYESSEEGLLIQHFKDDVTAFNRKKSATLPGKGAINNRISEYLMTRLENIGIPTHFVKRINMREQLVRQVDIIPVEMVVRNVAAGSICKRLGLQKGQRLNRSILEMFLKDDNLDDPMITEEHITFFELASPQEIDDMVALTLRINDFLQGLFLGANLILVDMKLEFGRHYLDEEEPRILLSDELSPDSMRLWDAKTGSALDKDVFREDTGDLTAAYTTVARKLGITDEKPNPKNI